MSYLYNFLIWLASCIPLIKCQTHAFIQIDSELRYLVDGITIPMNEVLEVKDSEQRHDAMYGDRLISKNFLLFDPPFLGFKEHPTGIPKMKKVYVQNTSPDMSIHLHSLSGNTMHFHCTFFQDKVIAPGGNTSFDVVFLGREEGFIENTIYVHTSIGTYRYWVKAVGVSNPYRIRPLIGLKMPLNSSFSSAIQVHNPHPKDLKIVELYSTGGDLHLELPEGVQEGESDHWTIPPYQTKPLMRVTFVARRENNHTAYIRIVPEKPLTDFLVIPVEVEVSSEQGLFFPSDSLYFGMLTPQHEPVTLPLFLLNSAHKHIHIQNIITSTVNEAISIDFKPVKIPPGTVHPTQVATITFNPAKAINGEKVSGKLLIKSKISAYKLAVPFSVDLHKGELLYNSSLTRFYSGPSAEEVDEEFSRLISSHRTSTDFAQKSENFLLDCKNFVSLSKHTPLVQTEEESQSHDLVLKNVFKFPIVVYNVTLAQDAKDHFNVKWNGLIVIDEGKKAIVATVNLLSRGSNISMDSYLTVYTNITHITIPLVAYNGRLTKHTLQNDANEVLDFGTLGMGEQHNNYFYLFNENPVNVNFKAWGSLSSRCAVEFMGVVEGNLSSLARHPNKSLNSKDLLVIKPNHYAIFRIGVLTPDSEGIFHSEAYVKTQYQVMQISFRLRTASGLLSIFPNYISMENSFPGKISQQDIHILSTFGHTMSVEGISPQSHDVRFAYQAPEEAALSNSLPILNPGHQSLAGRLIFDPSADCFEDCYSGFTLLSKMGQQWTNTFGLSQQTQEFDVKSYQALQERFHNVPLRSFNSSLFLDTTEVRGHQFNAKVSLIWPHLVPKQDLEFDLTPLHTSVHKDLVIHNPASQPILVQVLLLHHYPAPESLFPIISQQHKIKTGYDWKDFSEESSSHSFSLHSQDVENGSKCNNTSDPSLHPLCSNISDNSQENILEQHRKLEANFKMRVSKDSLTMFVQPNSQAKVRVGFSPSLEKSYSSFLLLRNNLTILESIWLEGSGGIGHLSFEKINLKSMSLHFLVQESPKNCTFISSQMERQVSLYSKHQSFIIKNDGKLPIEISRFSIGNSPCQNYGFKIVNCSRFLLQPNQSYKIEVMFIPDFSLFHVEQTLVIETSLNSIMNYSSKKDSLFPQSNGKFYLHLIGSISPAIIVKCSEQISRPAWEPLMYYSVVTILVAMLIGTIIRSYLEAEHTFRTSFIPMVTFIPADQPPLTFEKSKVFDLQNIDRSFSDKCHSRSSVGGDSSRSNSPIYTKINNLTSPDIGKKPYVGLSYDKIKANTSPVNTYISGGKHEREFTFPEKPKIGLRPLQKNNLLSISSLLPSFALNKEGKKAQNSHSTSKNISHKNDTIEKNDYPDSDPEVIDNGINVLDYIDIKEEISSTATDSSNAEDNSCYSKENLFSDDEKPKKKKNRTDPLKSKIVENGFPIKDISSQRIDTGFEITTKNKRIKKIKELPSKRNGSALELPYTLKHNAKHDSEQDSDVRSHNKSKRKILSQKENLGNFGFPPKMKDSLINLQETERRVPAKAIVAPRVQHQVQPLAPRDPSYSAVVLGNTKRAKTTPVGKIVPERKYVEKLDNPLGYIGQPMTYPRSMADMVPPQSNAIKSIPMTGAPLHAAPPSFNPPQDPASIHSLYSRMPQSSGVHVSPVQQAVSSHSWDPKTLSSPRIQQTLAHSANLGLDNYRKSAMTDEDFISFDDNNMSSIWNAESDMNANNGTSFFERSPLPAPPPTSPTLWDTLSFSIWSSPWSTDLSTLGRSSKSNNYGLSSVSRSPWQENFASSENHIGENQPPGASRNTSGPKYSSPYPYNRYINPNSDDLQDNH